MRARAPDQLLAVTGAATFLLLGLLGLVPGATTRYGDLSFAGSGSGARLFGVFSVSILLDLVHLLLGAGGLLVARRAGAGHALSLLGCCSLALWLLGVAGAGDPLALGYADNWLHFVLGVASVGAGRAAG